MTKKMLAHNPARYIMAWAVHLFTASAACVGLLTLANIYQHQYVEALWLMGIAVVIDAIDGTFARLVQVKKILPSIDGTLLDNIVDYLNYVITPCFFLFVKSDMLPSSIVLFVIMGIILTSAYQFCQSDAKTPDHFFKGFPCYWNIVIFYMFILNTNSMTNAIVLTLLCFLIFIPFKYIYPSRIEYLTRYNPLKMLMHVASLTYGISSAMVLWNYPLMNAYWLNISISYIFLYLILSFYRTFWPLSRFTS